MSDFLGQLQAAKTDEEREWLVIKFSLDALDPAVREAVWAAAIPQWFDEHVLAALLGGNRADGFVQIFEKLKSLSFVEVFQSRGYNVHERSRAILLKRLWAIDRDRYRELNQRAADYCGSQDEMDSRWIVATLYHRMLAKADPDTTDLIREVKRWYAGLHFSDVEALVRALIPEGKAQRLNARVAAWAHCFQGEVDLLFSRYESAKENMMVALSIDSEDSELRARSLRGLGSAHLMFDQHEQARKNFVEASELFRKLGDQYAEGSCIMQIGEIHRMKSEYENALQKYEEALKLFRETGSRTGEANSNLLMGLVYSRNEPTVAHQKLSDALRLFREIGDRLGEVNTIVTKGDVSLSIGDYEVARQQYEEALTLARGINNRRAEANSVLGLGNLNLALGQRTDAKIRFAEASALYRELQDSLFEAHCLRKLNQITNHSDS